MSMSINNSEGTYIIEVWNEHFDFCLINQAHILDCYFVYLFESRSSFMTISNARRKHRS